MDRTSFLVLLLIVLLSAGAGFFVVSIPSYKTLTVFAASSLEGSFKDIALVFEDEYPDVRISFTFASSSTLRTQIELGAMTDVFASADVLQMKRLQDADLLLGEPQVFATNSLVVISERDNDKVIKVMDLGMPGVRLAVAHPDVPAGAYALMVLEKMGTEFGEQFYGDVLENVVTWEINVRQVLTKVIIGEVDAGIVYLSDTLWGDIGKVRSIPIIPSHNIVALYPISAIGNESDPKLARQFVDLLLSGKGQEILAEHGFGGASLEY
jgi:molybdate transport system substrate-binding protein